MRFQELVDGDAGHWPALHVDVPHLRTTQRTEECVESARLGSVIQLPSVLSTEITLHRRGGRGGERGSATRPTLRLRKSREMIKRPLSVNLTSLTHTQWPRQLRQRHRGTHATHANHPNHPKPTLTQPTLRHQASRQRAWRKPDGVGDFREKRLAHSLLLAGEHCAQHRASSEKESKRQQGPRPVRRSRVTPFDT